MELENNITETESQAPQTEPVKEEKPVTLPSDEGKDQATPESPTEQTQQEQAEKQLDQSGLNLSVFENEYAEKGELSEESYKALEKAGIGRAVVDAYIEGQKVLVTTRVTEIKNSVGGETEYARMIAWAGDNLTAAEKQAFNAVVTGRDMAQIKLAVDGLAARFKSSAGYVPAAKFEGTPAQSAATGYASRDEMVRDIRDPRYKTDEAYQRKVAEKAARSRF